MNFVRIFAVILAVFCFCTPALFADENTEFIELNWWNHFGLGFKLGFQDYTDLTIKSRSIPDNDLGLIFNYPTVGDQDSAEHLRWKETDEIGSIHWFNDIGIGRLDLSFGYGAVQIDTTFNNDSVPMSGKAYEIGADLKINAGRKWQVFININYSIGEAENSTLDQVDSAQEKLTYEWNKFNLNISASKKFKYGSWTLKPHAGFLYSVLNVDEEYKAFHLVNETRLKMELENESSTQLRAVMGLMVEIPGNYPLIDMEFGIGADKTYDVTFSLVQFF